MSLAKKYNRKRKPILSDYHKDEDWAQYNYSDEYTDRNNGPHHFHNMDYDSRNYWPSYHEEEDFAHHDDESFAEDEFTTNEGVNRFSRAVPRRRRLTRIDSSDLGFRRRYYNEPNPYYTDRYYYDPSNEDQRHEDYDDGDYSGYDYYESYPRYGDISEREARFRRSNEFPQSGFDKRREREQGLRRRGERPNIREKRY